MKITKKLLSVLLAAALILGTVAVAAYAETPVLTYEGSVTNYTMSTDKTVDGVTNIKIGETVTVNVYMQTNYYLGSAGGEYFLWSSGIFEDLGSNYTVEEMAAKYKMQAIFNPSNPLSYPAGYGADDYVGIQFARSHNSENRVPWLCSEPTPIYTLRLTVKDDESLIGKTGTIGMPEGLVMSATNKGRRGLISQAVNKSATALGGGLDVAYSETTTVPTLTFNIVSATEYCDYTALQATYDACDELAKADEFYDATKLATYKTDLAAAKALLDVKTSNPLEKTDENEATIAAAKTALQAAYDALTPEYVSLAALNSAIGDCSTPAKAEEFYDAGAYSDWDDALTDAQNAVTAYTNEANTQANRDAVALAASNLREAFAALTPEYVSLAALNTTITNCKTPAYAEEFYDAGDYSDWDDALTDAQNAVTAYTNEANTQANRDKVAAAASALQTAYDNLVPKFVSLTALNKAITDYDTPAYAEEFYDAGDYADWEDALTDAQNAVTAYTNKADTTANRNAVAAAASNLKTAYENLVPKFVSLTALNKAIEDYDTPAKAAEFYDAGDYADWEDALTDAQNAVTAYTNKADTTANRNAVAAAASALETAFKALVPKVVSVDALVEQINKGTTLPYAAEYYDEAAYSDYEDALTDAENAKTAYENQADTAENRKAVEDATAALEAALAALTPSFVTYGELDDALGTCSTPALAQSNYSTASWDRWVAAKAAADELNNNKPDPIAPASDAAAQKEINDAAAELKAAFAALEVVEVVSGHITNVEPAVEHYQLNQSVPFKFTVDTQNAVKVQVIRSNGTTSTYSRTHSAVTSIVKNDDGTEVWTINISIITDEGVYGAKAKFKTWDTAAYSFDIKTSFSEDAAVKSADLIVDGAAVTEMTTLQTGSITIVTGKDAKRVRLVAPNGATMTLSRPSSVNPDGTKVWKIGRAFNAGTYSYTVWAAGSSNALAATDFKVEFTVTDPAIVTGPSTGNASDAVISATVAKKRILRGADQTFNIVTDKNATAVKLVDEAGAVIAIVRTGATADGDTLVWSFPKNYNYAASFTYKVEALYGETWMTSDKTVTFSVAY